MEPIDAAAVLRRMPYQHESLPFVLLWSEKSGCTSLLKWFLAQTGELAEATAHSDWIHDWELAVMKARPDYLQQLVHRLNGGDPAFKHVRHPFDRAVSSYLMLITLGDDSGHFTVPLRQQIRTATYGSPDVPYSFGFLDALRWMSTQDIRQLDDHLAPQHTDLEDRLTDLTLIRLESFDHEIRQIEQRFGLAGADLGSVTRSGHHIDRIPTDDRDVERVARLHPPLPLVDHRDWPVPPADEFRSPEAVELVAEIYRVDYDAYAYDDGATTPALDDAGSRLSRWWSR